MSATIAADICVPKWLPPKSTLTHPRQRSIPTYEGLRAPPYSQKSPNRIWHYIFFIFLKTCLRPWQGVNSDLRYWKSKISLIHCKSSPFSLDFVQRDVASTMTYCTFTRLRQPHDIRLSYTIFSSPSCFQTLASLPMPSHPTTDIPHPPMNVSFAAILRLSA